MNDIHLKLLKDNGKVVYFNESTKSWMKSTESFLNENIDKENKISPLLRQYLVQNKVLMSDNFADYKRRFRTIYISLTDRCNMKCEFCANSNGRSAEEDEFSFKDFEEIVIPKLTEMDPRNMVISGGEPFMRKDLFVITNLIKKTLPKAKIVLQTNGLLIGNGNMNEIITSVDRIDISIEGFFQDVNIINQMINTFELLTKYSIDIACSYVVNKNTIKNIYDALDFCERFNTSFTPRLMSPLGRAIGLDDVFLNEKEILALYEHIAQYLLDKDYKNNKFLTSLSGSFPFPKKSCEGYESLISISSNGDIHCCLNLRDHKFKYGNILLDEVNTINKNLVNSLTEEKASLFQVSESSFCGECSLRYFCCGFCAAKTHYNGLVQPIIDTCKIKYIMTRYHLFYVNQKKDLASNLRTYIELLNKNNEVKEIEINVTC